MNRKVAVFSVVGTLVPSMESGATQVPVSLSGAEIFDSAVTAGVGSFPRMGMRDISVNAATDELIFGDGGLVREVLWRYPVHPAVGSKSGDTVVLTATLDWTIIDDPQFDGELVMTLSDASRMIGASFGFDGGNNFDAAILHDECDFGDVYTYSFLPSDIKQLEVDMPITIEVEVGPDGSTLTARNADPSDDPVTFEIPYTLDVTQQLEFLVGGREADTYHIALAQADLDFQSTAGPLRNKWDLDIRTDICGDLTNNPPIARCKPITVVAEPNSCEVCDPDELSAMDDQSFDPDGHAWEIEKFTPACVPLGTHIVNMKVTDEQGFSDVCAAPVTVVDEHPPDLSLRGEDREICGQGPERVEFVPPTASDTCGGMVTITGEIIEVDGVAIVPSVALDGNHAAEVLAGSLTLEWTATDNAGNQNSATEVVEVLARTDLPTCCPNVDWWVTGNHWGNFINYEYYSDAFGVDARGGSDIVLTGYGDDCVLAGSGHDTVDVGPGDNLILGGSGNDQLYSSWWSDHFRVDAGRGHDQVYASWSDTSDIRGGTGDDELFGGHYGDDFIAPGSGHDHVYARGGDDVVILYDACEFHPGKYFDGGSGNDTLISPVPMADLTAAGVAFSGFENFVVDQSRRHLAACD